MVKTISTLSELKVFSSTGCRKKDVIEEVSDPINPIPTSISKEATILPALVAGDKSPYPTVVAVTKDHHKASWNFICSKYIIANVPARMDDPERIKTYLNPLVFRNLLTLVRNLADTEPILNSLVNFANLKTFENFKILKILNAELKGSIAIRSNRFSLKNFFF